MPIKIEIVIDEKGAVKSVKNVDAALDGLEKTGKKTVEGTKNLSDGFLNLGNLISGALVLGAMYKLKSALSDIMVVGNQQIAANAKLEATWRATGRGADVSTSAVMRQATAFQHLTGIGDETVINANAILAIYDNIATETFPDVIARAADLSVLLGTDLTDATRQLAFAMNDPIEGLTRLKRSGIQFSETQEKMIRGFVEQNRVADAQALIMSSLEARIGGVAEAMGETAVGKINRFTSAWGDLKEAIWAAIAANETFNETLDWWTKYFEHFTAPKEPTMDEWLKSQGFSKTAQGAFMGGLAAPGATRIGWGADAIREWQKYQEMLKWAAKNPATTWKPPLATTGGGAEEGIYPFGVGWSIDKYKRQINEAQALSALMRAGEGFETDEAKAKELDQAKFDRQMRFIKIREQLAESQARNSEMEEAAIQRQIGAWMNLGDTISNTMMHAMTESGNAFQNIADAFRGMLANMAAQFAAKAAIFQIISLLAPTSWATKMPSMAEFVFGNLFRAGGGDVYSRHPYIVGERGPELFVPQQAGKIIPNQSYDYSSSSNANFYLNGSRSGDREFVSQLRRVLRDNPELKRALISGTA